MSFNTSFAWLVITQSRCRVILSLVAVLVCPSCGFGGEALNKMGASCHLDPSKVRVVVSQSKLQALPTVLPIFEISSKPFLTAHGIDWLMNELGLRDEEKVQAQSRLAQGLAPNKPKSFDFQIGKRGYVFVDSAQGTIRVSVVGTNDQRKIPVDASRILSLDAFQKEINELCKEFGWPNSDIQRGMGGEYYFQCIDQFTGTRHHRTPQLASRRVTASRCINGRQLKSADLAFSIKLEREATGEWTHFDLFWPRLDEVRNIAMIVHSADELKTALRLRNVIQDSDAASVNTVDISNAECLTINHVGIFYIYAAEAREIEPALALYTTVKRASESQETVFYLPLR